MNNISLKKLSDDYNKNIDKISEVPDIASQEEYKNKSTELAPSCEQVIDDTEGLSIVGNDNNLLFNIVLQDSSGSSDISNISEKNIATPEKKGVLSKNLFNAHQPGILASNSSKTAYEITDPINPQIFAKNLSAAEYDMRLDFKSEIASLALPRMNNLVDASEIASGAHGDYKAVEASKKNAVLDYYGQYKAFRDDISGSWGKTEWSNLSSAINNRDETLFKTYIYNFSFRVPENGFVYVHFNPLTGTNEHWDGDGRLWPHEEFQTTDLFVRVNFHLLYHNVWVTDETGAAGRIYNSGTYYCDVGSSVPIRAQGVKYFIPVSKNQIVHVTKADFNHLLESEYSYFGSEAKPKKLLNELLFLYSHAETQKLAYEPNVFADPTYIATYNPPIGYFNVAR